MHVVRTGPHTRQRTDIAVCSSSRQQGQGSARPLRTFATLPVWGKRSALVLCPPACAVLYRSLRLVLGPDASVRAGRGTLSSRATRSVTAGDAFNGSEAASPRPRGRSRADPGVALSAPPPPSGQTPDAHFSREACVRRYRSWRSRLWQSEALERSPGSGMRSRGSSTVEVGAGRTPRRLLASPLFTPRRASRLAGFALSDYGRAAYAKSARPAASASRRCRSPEEARGRPGPVPLVFGRR
jgi:hypothetical protein